MEIISSDKAFDRVSRKIIDLHLCDSLKKLYGWINKIFDSYNPKYIINIGILSCDFLDLIRIQIFVLFMSQDCALFHNENFHFPFRYAILVHISCLPIGYL